MNTHEHAWTPMGTHEHLSTHEHPWTPMSNEHPWIHMNSSECSWKRHFFQIKCSWQFTCWTIYLTVFKLLCLVFGYAFFCVNCFFWALCLCWCVMYFCLSCIGFAPRKTIHCHCCKTWLLTYIYMHIYICVCVGVSQNEVSCFPLKATVLEPKKDTSFWDIPTCVYIYNLYFVFWHVLFVSILC